MVLGGRMSLNTGEREVVFEFVKNIVGGGLVNCHLWGGGWC